MTVIPRPKGKFIIPVRTLFNVKVDNVTGETICKSRVVARGDIQKRRLHIVDKYRAPVAGAVAVRIYIILSLNQESRRQGDVSTALLHGLLHKTIYLELPDGHPKKQGKLYVWKTTSSLYGLLESAHAWFMRIYSVLLELGFKSLLSDNCFFQLHNDQGSIHVLLYVDDLLFSGSTSLCDWLETKLCDSFLGEIYY